MRAYRVRTLVQILFYTGQRLGEVSRMQWGHLAPRLDARDDGVIPVTRITQPVVWTIPASEAKNNQAHEVPLSMPAVKLLQDFADTDEAERRRINTEIREKRHQAIRGRAEWVFTSPSTDGPIREMQKAVQRLRRRCGFHFAAHDLRRTAATLMPDAGVPENIIPKILNHKEPGVTRRHYNLHQYRAEKRAALDAWARCLDRLVASDYLVKGTVVSFRRP